MLRLTLAVSVFGVAVGAVSTAAWFQINNSISPTTNVQTNGVRTDAFVYNENQTHTNDDAANLNPVYDDGNTISYDHSSRGNAVDFYIIGGNGTFASMNWDESKALQMYDNPNNTSDIATYFRLHLAANTEFKIAEGSTDIYYGWNSVSSSSTMYSNFAASTNGGDDKNIKCVTEGTYDIYMNYNHDIFLQNHVELTDNTQLGNMVGFYLVGSNTSKTNGVASTGAFEGGNFDFQHGYSMQVDGDYEASYYGLHLYSNDIFKVWDGRTRDASGWYGFSSITSQPTSDGATNCFVVDNGTGADNNIKCQYEGYYDICLSGSPSGNIYTHSITIKFHEEPAPASLAKNETNNVEKKARRNSVVSGNTYYLRGYCDGGNHWDVDSNYQLNDTGNNEYWINSIYFYANNEFKIANSDYSHQWNGSNKGTGDAVDKFTWNNNGNIKCNQNGWYKLSLHDDAIYINFDNDYKILGIGGDWNVRNNVSYCMTVNPSNASEYMIYGVSITSSDIFKVYHQGSYYGTIESSGAYQQFENDGSGNVKLKSSGVAGRYNFIFKTNSNQIYISFGSYTVTLDKNASSATAGTAEVTATYNSAMPTEGVTMPTRTGYNFNGYYDTSATSGGTQYYTNAGASARSWNKTSDTTLYARWGAKTYNISYAGMDGATHGTTHPTSGTYDTVFYVSAPTKSGYTFTGWTVTAGLNNTTAKWGTTNNPSTTISSSSTVCVNGASGNVYFKNINPSSTAVKLTATWSKDTYTIGYTLNGGSIDGENPTSYQVDTATFTLINPTKAGNRFTGWSGTDLTGSDNTTVTIAAGSTGNRSYTAHWEEIPTYTITWKNYDGTVLETDNNVPEGDTPTYDGSTPTKPQTNQYTFSFTGWSPTVAAASSNQIYVAQFSETLRTYTVTIERNETGWGTVSQASVTEVPYGTVITSSNNTVTINGTIVTATYAAQTDEYTYAFGTWTNGTATVQGPTTVTANFTRVTREYTINITVNTVGYGTVSPTSIDNVPYGSTISVSDNVITINGTPVTATAKAATAQYTWSFVNWTINNASNNNTKTKHNTSIVANFNQVTNSYTVSFNMKGHGDSVSSQNINYGSKVTEPSPAPSAVGWAFEGWYKENALTNAWNFSTDTVTGATTLYAKWRQLTQYTITFKVWKDGAQVSTTSKSYYEGGSTTSPAMPTDAYFGYAIPTKWTTNDNGTGTEYNPSIAISPDANITLYAAYTTSGSNIHVYFDTNDVKTTWGLSGSSYIWVHCWYSNASTGNQVVSENYKCSVINGATSAYQYIWWDAEINSNVTSIVFTDGDNTDPTYDHQTTDITTDVGNKRLYKILSSKTGNKWDWEKTTTLCSGDIRSVTIKEKKGSNTATTKNTYYVLDHESWKVPSGYIGGLTDYIGYITPSKLTTEPNGSGTQYSDGNSFTVSEAKVLYAYYSLAGFYLVGKTWNTSNSTREEHWYHVNEDYISNTGSIDGSTLTFTQELYAQDEVKIYSANASTRNWVIQGAETWTANTAGAQVENGGNVRVRYHAEYEISCTVDANNNISDFNIVATKIYRDSLTLAGVVNGTSSEYVSKDGSNNYTFTWSNLTLLVGQQIAAEAVVYDSVVKEAWGYSFKSGFTDANFFKGGASSVDSSVYKIGSTFHRTGVTITLTFGPSTNTLTLTNAGTKVDYVCSLNNRKPTGIYLVYGSNNPSTLAEAQNVQRMFYDSDTSGLYYSGNAQKYDKKASYSILTVATTVNCKIFHGLDVADTAISALTSQPLYTSSGATVLVYPRTTGVTGVAQQSGYFTLDAGSYVVTLIGKDGYSPSAAGSDYAIAIKRVTGSINTALEHEVPIYAIGRGMPGSELATGDYTCNKVKIGANTFNRYIPFYAAAGQSDVFPCYAKTQDNVVGDSNTTITLKAGDVFVFSDGITTKSTFSFGTNTSAADINTVAGKIVVYKSGSYTISAAKGSDDTLGRATFTITATNVTTPAIGGNDSGLQAQDNDPIAYSKQHGVRILNATGSTINIGGSFDSSLLDSGKAYISFIVELRHINTSATGTISASFANLPIGTKYRYVQTDSSTANITAMDDGLSWPNAFTTSTVANQAIFSDQTLSTNTNTISVGQPAVAVDNCFAKSTLIEIQIPFASLATAAEIVSLSFNFSINITFTETITA